MGYLMLEDKMVYSGSRAWKEACGKWVVYNGSQGHQEVLYDPAVNGKIVIYTFPYVGNCGALNNKKRPYAAGVIGSNIATEAASYGCEKTFSQLLVEHNIAFLEGIDTRELALYLSKSKVQYCAIAATLEVCDCLLEKPQPPTALLPKSTLSKKAKIALIDLGISAKDKAMLLNKAPLDCYNALTKYQEVADYQYYIFCGADEGNLLPAFDLCKEALKAQKSVVGLGIGHYLVAVNQGWKLRKKACFIGETPIKHQNSERVFNTYRNDLFSLSGQGKGEIIYCDAADNQEICGLVYDNNSFSLAWAKNNLEELDSFIAGVLST